MTKFLTDLKNAVTGNYVVKTTPSAGIKPAPYAVAYPIEEINEVFEKGLTGRRETTAP